jgi:hypothetical protein
MHCDRLFFAFAQDLRDFPRANRPDRRRCLWRASALRGAGTSAAPPTRKLMTIRFGIAAAQRINRLVDPQGHGEF